MIRIPMPWRIAFIASQNSTRLDSLKGINLETERQSILFLWNIILFLSIDFIWICDFCFYFLFPFQSMDNPITKKMEVVNGWFPFCSHSNVPHVSDCFTWVHYIFDHCHFLSLVICRWKSSGHSPRRCWDFSHGPTSIPSKWVETSKLAIIGVCFKCHISQIKLNNVNSFMNINGDRSSILKTRILASLSRIPIPESGHVQSSFCNILLILI